jgi:hypothetical protein
LAKTQVLQLAWHLGYDHVVILLALIKLDYNLTSTSWHSSSGLRGRRRTYRTILEWADHALFKMVRYVLLPEDNLSDAFLRKLFERTHAEEENCEEFSDGAGVSL